MTAPEISHREQLFALLPPDTPDAVPWTSRQLCKVSGLEWEIVTATIENMRRAGVIRKVGGTRGLGYLWVRAVEKLTDGRAANSGRHGNHAKGNDHWARKQRQAARGQRLRPRANAHPGPKASLADGSPLAHWPRVLVPIDSE